jgi:pyruvate kinase
MMESMISSPVPTRAEVSDVANAVLDGTDAVMLSAETAAGTYPVETVEAMARVCIEAEKSSDYRLDRDVLNREFARVDQSIAMAALFTANHLPVKAIVALTQTGATALWTSRVNCGVPIYAMTPEVGTYRKLALYRDVYPMMLAHDCDQKSLLVSAEVTLLQQALVQPGDLLVVTVGDAVGQMGSTNTMKIVRVAARN